MVRVRFAGCNLRAATLKRGVGHRVIDVAVGVENPADFFAGETALCGVGEGALDLGLVSGIDDGGAVGTAVDEISEIAADLLADEINVAGDERRNREHL